MRIGLLVVALIVTALFIALGLWQLDRAAQKSTTFAEFERRGNAPKVDLNQRGFDDATELLGYRSVASGHYLGTTVLLDNQMHQGRAGYLVYTAFRLDGRPQSVLVNRGWINAGADRSRAPEFATPIISQRLEGRLSLPPQRGLRLKGSDLVELLANGTWRVQGIDFTALTASIGTELLPVTVLLDDNSPDGFVRAWTPPGMGESRHLGYAFQWFALAITVMVVTLILTLRRGKAGTS